jgi:hypothetical protein
VDANGQDGFEIVAKDRECPTDLWDGDEEDERERTQARINSKFLQNLPILN